MKVGDLICYNAAGMKYKTLGLLLEIDSPKPLYGSDEKAILVQWCVVGKYMPRRDYRNGDWSRDPIKSGQRCWHPIGDWFEVSK
tara:strand:+ start:464 stop:715 length:252 start_codon:yes stop_codon:yes gene_type:complete